MWSTTFSIKIFTKTWIEFYVYVKKKKKNEWQKYDSEIIKSLCFRKVIKDIQDKISKCLIKPRVLNYKLQFPNPHMTKGDKHLLFAKCVDKLVLSAYKFSSQTISLFICTNFIRRIRTPLSMGKFN